MHKQISWKHGTILQRKGKSEHNSYNVSWNYTGDINKMSPLPPCEAPTSGTPAFSSPRGAWKWARQSRGPLWQPDKGGWQEGTAGAAETRGCVLTQRGLMGGRRRGSGARRDRLREWEANEDVRAEVQGRVSGRQGEVRTEERSKRWAWGKFWARRRT